MRRRTFLLAAVAGSAAAAGTLAGCTEKSSAPAPPPGPDGARTPQLIRGRSGSFVFDHTKSVADRPITVRYRAPKSGLSQAKVLIVMTGTGRNAREYLDDWRRSVDADGVVVLVPQFDVRDYPVPYGYNLGSMVGADGAPTPSSEWIWDVPEALFDAVRADIGATADGYSIWGHSAGAQFVHRFVLFGNHPRLRRAVAANAGWYTLPDESVGFPYGLAGAPARPDLRSALAADLVLMLGGDDTDPEDEQLRKAAQAEAQGATRLERGRHFQASAAAAAQRLGVPVNWRVQVVDGVAHDHTGMAQSAPGVLFN